MDFVRKEVVAPYLYARSRRGLTPEEFLRLSHWGQGVERKLKLPIKPMPGVTSENVTLSHLVERVFRSEAHHAMPGDGGEGAVNACSTTSAEGSWLRGSGRAESRCAPFRNRWALASRSDNRILTASRAAADRRATRQRSAS